MSTTAKGFRVAKYAENAQTDQYTSTGARTIIDKFTAYNGTAGVVTLAVNLVTSGGAAGASNLLVSRSIAAGETYTFPEVVGHVMEPGESLSTLAGAATSLVIRASGRVVVN